MFISVCFTFIMSSLPVVSMSEVAYGNFTNLKTGDLCVDFVSAQLCDKNELSDYYNVIRYIYLCCA